MPPPLQEEGRTGLSSHSNQLWPQRAALAAHSAMGGEGGGHCAAMLTPAAAGTLT